MAKLTVFFRDKAINSGLFKRGTVRIGRDKSNEVMIDSLAVAPTHAVIIINECDSIIQQVDSAFPLIVNGKKIEACNLNNNDIISIGKHDILFNDSGPAVHFNPVSDHTEDALPQTDHELSWPLASLQVMTGEHIGKVLQLKKLVTRLGYDSGGVVALSRRKEGYFIAVLKDGQITVNNEPVADKSIKLNANDIIVIDDTALQFFLS